MKEISAGIREVIESAKPNLLKLTEEEVSRKSAPEVWSKKEIAGHLIDSASNNHQRFVRAAQNIAMEFPPYNQNRFAEVQHCNERRWPELVEFLYQYNLHLAHVIDSLPEEALENPCSIGKEKPAALKIVIEDYLRHLKHHIERLLGD